MRENMIMLESVDSTNEYLKRLAHDGAEDGTVVGAFEQTAGKGRQHHTFQSNKGGIYLSMFVKCDDLSINDIMTVTAKTGVCVCLALQDAFGLHAGIKWVNDVIYHEKKICGILVEGSPVVGNTIPGLIIGIGVNLNQESFSPELADIATSLKIEHGREFSIPDFVDALVSRLDELRADLTSKAYLEKYRELCVTVGQEVSYTIDQVPHSCRALGIDASFGLITEDGVLKSGEVSVRRK